MQRQRKSTESIQISGLISWYRPEPTLPKVKDRRPRLSPVAMRKVSGVATTVMNAGNASLKSSHFTRAMQPHISAPQADKCNEQSDAGGGSVLQAIRNIVDDVLASFAQGQL